MRLYDQPDLGAPLWSETHPDTPLLDGVFVLALGDRTPLRPEHIAGPRWLELTVNNDGPLAPRQPLGAAPYALAAAQAISATTAFSASQIAWTALTGVPPDLADGDDVGVPLTHTHAGGDITGAVPTATLALSTTQAAWSGLTGMPAGFADGVDNTALVVSQTAVYAGEGLIQTASSQAVTLSVRFAGPGQAGSVARSDHDHAGSYAPAAHTHAGSDITGAVPTATLALTATQAPWAGLTGVPADLADGDDVGVYSAGFGLAITAGQFSVVTTAVQARIAAACAPGSLIVAVQPDGAPICQADAPLNRLARPAANTLSTLDSAGDVGQYASVTIGADGLPIVSYHDEDNGALKVAHCQDVACTAAAVTTLDAACGSAWWTSIAIGADGYPIISYYSDNDGALKVAHCQDAACAAAVFSLVDDPAGATVGYYSSIAIGSDGLPVISYHDASQASLKVAHCQDIACATAVSVTLDASADVGWWTTIAVGADGLPVIAYHDASLGAQGLKVAHCADVTCSAAVSVTLDSGANLGWYASLAVGADGRPIISYYDFTHTALKVAHCQDVACSNAAISTLDDSADVGRFSALTIGADGLAIIAYHDFTNKTLRVAHCHDLACSAAASVLVDDTSANVGQHSALTVGVDGLPLLVYYDGAGARLRAAHCANPLCVPYFRRR